MSDLLRQFVLAFEDELEKIAVNVPVVHGTSGRWPLLRAGIGSVVSSTDPNPRGIYVAMQNRLKTKGVSDFAQSAVQAKGGEPVVAHAKVDTQKGWLPRSLNLWGKQNIGSLEDAHDLVHELDHGAVEPRRGEIWRTLHQGTGAWTNSDPTATLKPTKYTKVL